MKNLALVFLATLCFTASQAAIFRIGLPGGSTTGVDFPVSNIAGAISAASAGDTIQMYQQYWASSPSTVTVAKPLKFIGFGHTLDKNKNLQAVTTSDIYPVSLTFNSGSGGSIVTGLYCGIVQIGTSNVIVTRTRFSSYLQLNNSSALSNITITDCIIYTGSSAIIESSSFAISNLYIANNILYGQNNLPNSTGIFANNYIGNYTNPVLNSFIIRNNIFYNVYPAANSNSFAYNLFSGNFSGNVSGTGNVFNVNLANTFVNWNSGSITVDTQLVLKPSSPALGAGKNNANNATDCGIFGGEAGEEYIISGIPPVPSIYQLTAPSQTATGSTYNITVGIRSNK